MEVCIHIYIYVYVYVYIHIHIYIYIYISATGAAALSACEQKPSDESSEHARYGFSVSYLPRARPQARSERGGAAARRGVTRCNAARHVAACLKQTLARVAARRGATRSDARCNNRRLGLAVTRRIRQAVTRRMRQAVTRRIRQGMRQAVTRCQCPMQTCHRATGTCVSVCVCVCV